MNTTSYKKGIKPDEISKTNNSIVFFESINDLDDNEKDVNFITIEISRSQKNDHPEVFK